MLGALMWVLGGIWSHTAWGVRGSAPNLYLLVRAAKQRVKSFDKGSTTAVPPSKNMRRKLRPPT